MLVLSRKKDEAIVINDAIRIVVVEIRGDKVRLGVEAPREVPVHRNEVYEAIARGEPVDVALSPSASIAPPLAAKLDEAGGDSSVPGAPAALSHHRCHPEGPGA
jgi:carbon storage regulator